MPSQVPSPPNSGLDINITAFGPFANIVHNPTAYLLRHLDEFVAHSDGSPLPPVTGPSSDLPLPRAHAPTKLKPLVLPPGVRVCAREILEVSAVAVHDYIRRQNPLPLSNSDISSPSSNSSDSSEGSQPSLPTATRPRVHLHLGVAAGITSIHVESWGYNSAVFRCPDFSGSITLPCGATVADEDTKDVHTAAIAGDIPAVAALLRSGADGAALTTSAERIAAAEATVAAVAAVLAGVDDTDTAAVARALAGGPVLSRDRRGECPAALASTLEVYTLAALAAQTGDELTAAEACAVRFCEQKEGASESKMLPQRGVGVCVTNDPGAYLCNYLYYASLAHSAANPALSPSLPAGAAGKIDRDAAQHSHSLFVHIPTFTDVEERLQLYALAGLVTALYRALPRQEALCRRTAAAEMAGQVPAPRRGAHEEVEGVTK